MSTGVCVVVGLVVTVVVVGLVVVTVVVVVNLTTPLAREVLLLQGLPRVRHALVNELRRVREAPLAHLPEQLVQHVVGLAMTIIAELGQEEDALLGRLVDLVLTKKAEPGARVPLERGPVGDVGAPPLFSGRRRLLRDRLPVAPMYLTGVCFDTRWP